MANKIIYNPDNDTQNNPSLDYNQYFQRLITRLNEPTITNLIKVPKDVKQTNKKTLL